MQWFYGLCGTVNYLVKNSISLFTLIQPKCQICAGQVLLKEINPRNPIISCLLLCFSFPNPIGARVKCCHSWVYISHGYSANLRANFFSKGNTLDIKFVIALMGTLAARKILSDV